MLNDKTILKNRLNALIITIADLRQDQKAHKLGISIDTTPEEAEKLIANYSKKAQGIRAALET